ncbi:hypothetical protein ACFO25_05025 [Paenactinomyces guangxiensis]|uniref:Secreted protein n=1 Tax=Paenactinomyces guangxiensis TaxID=1490290 RepID=A0A7W2A6S9_9BACL|nr:hypothetical protein [Paenactinomyces guangxiensis]MBA4493741.1 hypothetical protein [Paenactinomyces guangxiensis]MBH8591029.1 hypothetical protein [Paenactinomyces guangxiensis]
MKKKMFSLLMILVASVVLPTSVFAEGWRYNLGQWSSWGSSTVTTSYPKLACTITNELGEGWARIQVKHNGKWKNAPYQNPETASLSKNKKITIKAPANKSSIYRIFIWTQNSGVRGAVYCKGSN